MPSEHMQFIDRVLFTSPKGYEAHANTNKISVDDILTANEDINSQI